MNLYTLLTDEGRRKKYAYGIIISKKVINKIYCPECKMMQENYSNICKDISYTLALSNDYYADFAQDTGLIYGYMILEKTLDILHLENITGFYTKNDLNILSGEQLTLDIRKSLKNDGFKIDKIANNPPKYHTLFANYGAKSHVATNRFITKECSLCGYLEVIDKGDALRSYVYLQKGTWNGNDLFRVKEYGNQIFCSERFKGIYEKYKLTGLKFDFNKVELID
jgi:hypothetical protein